MKDDADRFKHAQRRHRRRGRRYENAMTHVNVAWLALRFFFRMKLLRVCVFRYHMVLDRKQWAVLEPVVVRCPRSTHCVRGKRWKLACDAQAKRGKP